MAGRWVKLIRDNFAFESVFTPYEWTYALYSRDGLTPQEPRLGHKRNGFALTGIAQPSLR